MTIKRTFATTTLLASIVMIAISGTTSANAQIFSNQIPANSDVVLVELLDGSGSISGDDFLLQKNGVNAGLQAAFDDPNTNLAGKWYIIIIQFSTASQTECTGTINNQGDLDTLMTCISGITQLNGNTCMSCAFNNAVTELALAPSPQFNTDPEDRNIIDLITDGAPFPETQETALLAEEAAIKPNGDFDRVVALGVGSADTTFLALIVDPNPPGPIDPAVLPEDDGFVLTATTFNEFADALERKLIGTIVGECEKEPLPPQCVGGEFLPIDSTALLIAGMYANMGFIVPIAAGIVGAGAYLIRSRMNKD